VVRGNIDWTRSTAPGQIAQGMVIRVTITFAPNAHARGAALAQVVFDLGQGVVLVSIAEP